MSDENAVDDYGFSVGTRVVLLEEDPYGYVKLNSIGTVCHLIGDYFSDGCDIGVEWDEEDRRFHDCNGRCKRRHGRYVPHECLGLLDLDLGEIDSREVNIFSLFE